MKIIVNGIELDSEMVTHALVSEEEEVLAPAQLYVQIEEPRPPSEEQPEAEERGILNIQIT